MRQQGEVMRTMFLLDIDCFFASVEMALHPELKGKPLCIGGNRGERGIVACPNYEARAYGVKTAMPLRTAEKLLPPDAVFLRGSHRVYGEYSERVMNILYDFTPDVEQVSVDEAYMDVTGCLHFWKHDPVAMATAIKKRIMSECGLSVSVGVASNAVCAKIAAGLKKPDGLVVVPHGGEKEFLAPLPIDVVPGIGKKTAPRLYARGIFVVGDVLRQGSLSSSYVDRYLAAVANGMGDRRPPASLFGHAARYDHVEKSMSRDTTFGHDTNDRNLILATLFYLTERCCKTLRTRGYCTFTVTVKVRFTDFTTLQKQATLPSATANEEEVFAAAQKLLDTVLPPNRYIRLVGVKVSHLVPGEQSRNQMELAVINSEKLSRLHQRLDALQEKHGYTSIQWGITHALSATYKSDDDGYRLHSPVYEL
jgi:DNA polymerase-4